MRASSRSATSLHSVRDVDALRRGEGAASSAEVIASSRSATSARGRAGASPYAGRARRGSRGRGVAASRSTTARARSRLASADCAAAGHREAERQPGRQGMRAQDLLGEGVDGADRGRVDVLEGRRDPRVGGSASCAVGEALAQPVPQFGAGLVGEGDRGHLRLVTGRSGIGRSVLTMRVTSVVDLPVPAPASRKAEVASSVAAAWRAASSSRHGERVADRHGADLLVRLVEGAEALGDAGARVRRAGCTPGSSPGGPWAWVGTRRRDRPPPATAGRSQAGRTGRARGSACTTAGPRRSARRRSARRRRRSSGCRACTATS